MTTIRSVVAATDFSPASDAAVRRAVQLAQTHGTALCLLHAFDASAEGGPKGAANAQQETAALPRDIQMQQRLAEFATSLAAQTGIDVTVHFAPGPPARVIKAYVGSHDGGLVVIGSRAEPTQSGLGSTALTVVRRPACPILIVRVAKDKPYATVLSAVDLREGSLRAASLAVALFPAARHHLLYALDEDSDSDSWSELEAEQSPASMYSQAEHELQQMAQRLSAAARHKVVAVVADDVPARAILVGAANLGADCVVVGHHGLGTATDSYLGSMAQHVIYAALSDVLVVP